MNRRTLLRLAAVLAAVKAADAAANIIGMSGPKRYGHTFPDPPSGLQWPVHTPSYQSALPGHGGYGMNSLGGFNDTGDIAALFIDTNANTNSGSREPSLDRVDGSRNIIAYTGDWEWCWRHAGTRGGTQEANNKLIMPLNSGWMIARKSIPCPTATPGSSLLGNVSYGGQFAPAPGLVLRGCKPFWNGAGRCHAWHLHSVMGDDEEGLGGGSRDSLGGGVGGTHSTGNLTICCELTKSIDEIQDNYNPASEASYVYNAFYHPLHRSSVGHPDDPPGTDHGFGPFWGGQPDQPNGITSFRNLFAHTTGRNPFTNSRGICHANNLHYNHGRPDGGAGRGVTMVDNGATEDMFLNLLCNLFMRGPNNNNSLVACDAVTTIPSGSRGYAYGNAQHGWTAPANQNEFITDAPANFRTGTRTSAYPSSWGAGNTGILEWAANPLAPTLAEKIAYIELIASCVGCQPGRRAANSRLNKCLDQIREYLTEPSATTQFLDSMADDDEGGDGGWFSIPQVSVDPNNPGAHWHAPWPTGSNLLTPVASGTLANGLPAAGYTPLQIWWFNQHYYVGGR